MISFYLFVKRNYTCIMCFYFFVINFALGAKFYCNVQNILIEDVGQCSAVVKRSGSVPRVWFKGQSVCHRG